MSYSTNAWRRPTIIAVKDTYKLSRIKLESLSIKVLFDYFLLHSNLCFNKCFKSIFDARRSFLYHRFSGTKYIFFTAKFFKKLKILFFVTKNASKLGTVALTYRKLSDLEATQCEYFSTMNILLIN